MIVKILVYGDFDIRTIDCVSFEFRSNYVENWIRFKYENGIVETVHNVCVIKVESEKTE